VVVFLLGVGYVLASSRGGSGFGGAATHCFCCFVLGKCVVDLLDGVLRFV